MSIERSVASMTRLITLRARDVERLTVELASQQAMRERYVRNLERMEDLLASIDIHGNTHAALSLNGAQYKGALIDLIATHRNDLVRHDAGMRHGRQALASAACKHAGLDHVLQDKRQLLSQAHRQREQKQQDQLAVQAWSRSRPDAAGGGVSYPKES